MADTCYMFFATGFEEVEALSVVDLLRRDNIDIKMVSVTGKKEVTSSHNVTIVMDMLLEEVSLDNARMLIMPGGMPGVSNLKACTRLNEMIVEFNKNNGLLAAICAGPTVYGELGILEGKNAVCYPGCEEGLLGAKVNTCEVITDGNITTSRGMGTAIEFGLKLVEILDSKEKSDELRKKIVYRQ